MATASKKTHEDTLRQQRIDDDQPGTILRDFQVMLDYVEEVRPTLTKGLLLPLSEPPRINERLTHPIRVALQRPKQKSFPQVNGLFLLLRTSAIAQARLDGNHHRLVLDPDLLAQWQGLNPTERYFALLECWLVAADLAVIAEHGERDCFDPCERFIERHRRSGACQFPRRKDQDDHLMYTPGHMNLALMELFGFVRLEHGEPEPGRGWRILSLALTPLGLAIFSMLSPRYTPYRGFHTPPDWERIEEEGGNDPGPQSLDVLHPILGRYFPEWGRCLGRPTRTFQPGEYRFKVSLGARVWRRLSASGEAAWDRLASAILDAFGFDHDHLYCFRGRLPNGQTVELSHHYMDEGPFAADVRIGSLSLQPGDRLTFVYDFGDNWEFGVEVEEIRPENPALAQVTLLEQQGVAPEQYPIDEEG